ncbi:DNA-binding protein, partial [Acinetobacter baumannii]|nr:DNA-binding protein [Acinetobacter baumannii]
LKILITQEVISYTLCLELIRDLGEKEALEKIRGELNAKLQVIANSKEGDSLPLNVSEVMTAPNSRKSVRITKKSLGFQ